MNHLHCHSQYSALDGLSSVKEIVSRAKELKATAAVITDHGSISGLPELMKEAKEAGLNSVVGCEFYVVEAFNDESMKEVPRLHLCVWAKGWAGVCSIMRQLSLANRQFYRRPLIDISQALNFENCMVGTACCFGILSTDRYVENCRALHAAYGDDLYIEIMPHNVTMGGGDDLQRIVNVRGVTMARELGVKLLATNDSHYTLEEDAEAHRVMMATQYKKKLEEYEAWPPVFFMRDMAQMFTAFTGLGYLEHNDIAQAMMNTISIAEKVKIEMPVFNVNLPRIHENESRALIDLCLEGWKTKLHGTLGKQYNVYRKRLIYELDVIKKLKFIPYFLMVHDIIKWARGQGIIVGPARGSSAGSLVCYLMDITRVDPIKHSLYFERFLNPERNDLPDIDVDFQDDRRDEVINYIVERYGRDKVCQISTYHEMAIKGAFRDVARAYGIDAFKVNSVSKQLEEEEDFEKVPELLSFASANPDVVKFSRRLNGVIRGAGKHACGICISSQPIETVAVVEKRNNSMVTCWDKNQCEAFGLVKMDVLGLTTLSVFDLAIKDVERHHGKTIVLERIPLDDPATLKEFSAGNGDCVFQFESHGMQELLRSLKVEGFETLVACTALYRPGPLGAGLTERYAKVSRGLEYPRYAIPELEPILSTTNSVLVYQEQIMRVFNELGGFTWSEADKMRKIIGKKLGAEAFEEHREHFVNGCAKNGIQPEAAGELFSDMVNFAAYSFNKSHAVAYTMISFYSMWFKVHYPAIFLAAYMSCVKSDDAIAKGIREARRLGVNVHHPDVNLSTDKYRFDPDFGIIAPLSVVKGVGGKAVENIIKARNGMAFMSFEHFQDSIEKRVVNKRVVENMVNAGVFESLGIVEPDAEKRERFEAELMPTFDILPSLSLTKGKIIDNEALEKIRAEIESYYGEGKGLYPIVGKSSVIMIVNSQMKTERSLAGKPSTNYIFGRLGEVGIDKRFITYTSPVKVNLSDPKKAKTKDRTVGEAWLRAEIEAIRPKLIYCCTADAWPIFAPGEKISASYGRVRYVKAFNAFLLAGPSPQHAAWKPEEVKKQFDDCIDKIGKMFGGGHGM